MTLQIPNLNEFVASFLFPLSKVNNSCVIKVTKTGYNCLLSSADGSLILYCKLKQEVDCDDVSLNIPDLGRLIKILNCIDEENVDLHFTDNNINYKSTDIRFKYHLLEDGIISSPSINIEKLKSIDYNSGFKITNEAFLNLIKSSTFATDTDKIYLYTKDGRVYGELTDHEKHNSDSVTRCLANGHYGDEITDAIPVTFDTIRIVANNRAQQVEVLVNTSLSILTFNVNTDNVKNVYVVTGLVRST